MLWGKRDHQSLPAILVMVLVVWLIAPGVQVLVPSPAQASSGACSTPPATLVGFVTCWDTTRTGERVSDERSIALPLVDPALTPANYNFTVNWGDGSPDDTITSWDDTAATHVYATPGQYWVTITGTLTGFSFGSYFDFGTYNDAPKLIDVAQWGSDFSLGNSGGYFEGAANMNFTATDAPNLHTTSNYSRAFAGANAFNSPISHWDVSSAVDMSVMFAGAAAFNQDISSWQTGKVTSMEIMFESATAFNQPLDQWDTGNVTNMTGMFRFASRFNQNISSWDTSNVTILGGMFYGATDFNQPLNDWDVSNNTSLAGMFGEASSFNQPLDTWDTGNVTSMGSMFESSSSFNQPLDTWDTSNVQDMSYMFAGATDFNQPLNVWNTSSVQSLGGIFSGATSFNHSLSDWDTSQVTDMFCAFCFAQAFNQSLASWDVSSVTDMFRMFWGVTLGTEEYSDMLQAWSRQSVQNDVVFGGGSSQYLASVADARAFLTDTRGWSITDGGEASTPAPAPALPPSAPASAEVTVTNGEVTVSWEPPVSQGSFPVTNYQVRSTPSSTGCLVPATQTQCTVTNLTDGTSYSFRVRALNGAGWGPWLNAGSVTLGACTTPPETLVGFVTCWDTTRTGVGASDQQTVALPLLAGGTYNFTVDWGDGSAVGTVTSWDDTAATHVYATPGQYWVTITGTLTGFSFGLRSFAGRPNDGPKLFDVAQWGSDFSPGNGGRYFEGAANMNFTATDAPNLHATTDFGSAFAGATAFNSHISHWNVSNVTNMSGVFSGAIAFNQQLNDWDVANVTWMMSMFSNARSFNQNIDHWDVSNVISMGGMFSDAESFNQPIGTWDTSNLVAMERLFYSAVSFNQDISNWDIANVTSLRDVFADAWRFNQDISGWDTSNVTRMDGAFNFASDFNQDISGWDTSKVREMDAMFSGADSFNQNIEQWDVSNVTTMSYMFAAAEFFNQPLNNWDVSSVTDMGGMFYGASSFDQPLDTWDTSNVQDMSHMFSSAVVFNQPIGSWDTSAVTTMEYMFGDMFFPDRGALAFNQDISTWDTSAVTNMAHMFAHAVSFQQDISTWEVGNVTDMSDMFVGATSFNQSLASWDVSSVTDMSRMFWGVTLGTEEYSDMLQAWSRQSVQNDVVFGGGSSQYLASVADARAFLTNTRGWSITDGGEASTPAPAPALPPSAPASAVVTVTNGEVTVSWEPPVSQGSFPVTNYQVRSTPSSTGCLVPATQTQCTVTNLTDGTSYSFQVRALNGGGWGAWLNAGSVTPDPTVEPTIMISGTRSDVRGHAGIIINGSTTVLNEGSILRPWIRLPGQKGMTEGKAHITVDASGAFTWQRRTGKRINVQIRTADGGIRSERITIAAR